MLRQCKVIGGIGEKKSNNGTQYYLQNRIYDGDIAVTIATACNPYYVVSCASRKRGNVHKLEISNRDCANCITTINTDSMIAIKNMPTNIQKEVCNKAIENNLQLGVTVENMNNLAIRKLTPKECWRLQGFSVRNEDGSFDDSLFEKAEKVNTNSQLYKQAGNSITVDVLCHIFNSLFLG